MSSKKQKQEQKNMEPLERNPGMPLELEWIEGIQANTSAIERRAYTLLKRRAIKKNWQAAWLMKAVSFIDLTTLAGDDTPGRVARICAKASHPIRKDILKGFDMLDKNITTAAVCVYHSMAPYAVKYLADSNIPVAAVSTGFPAGQSPFETKIGEIKKSVAAGAKEIDIVISRSYVLTGNWEELYREVSAYREACGESHMKTILAVGDLGTLRNVARASMVCMMAGADFIKTSTGKERINATLPVGLVMVRQIREYYQRTGYKIGFKPAGGISKAKDALAWLVLIKEELGNDWLIPELFRFGASSLLGDIERQLEHNLTGRYSTAFRHPMA